MGTERLLFHFEVFAKITMVSIEYLIFNRFHILEVIHSLSDSILTTTQ